MVDILILHPDGDFIRSDSWLFSPDYKGSYVYHISKKVWYQWVPYADWMPINDCDVPDNYKSRLQLILLLT